MANTPLPKKLGMKPNQRALVLNAPKGYMQTLGELPEGVQVETGPAEGEYDFVQVFALDKMELDGYRDEAFNAVKPGGLLWFCYPKKSSRIQSDLTRDSSWDTLMDKGWRVVTSVSVDDTWSANRFRPIADVKSKKSA